MKYCELKGRTPFRKSICFSFNHE